MSSSKRHTYREGRHERRARARRQFSRVEHLPWAEHTIVPGLFKLDSLEGVYREADKAANTVDVFIPRGRREVSMVRVEVTDELIDDIEWRSTVPF